MAAAGADNKETSKRSGVRLRTSKYMSWLLPLACAGTKNCGLKLRTGQLRCASQSPAAWLSHVPLFALVCITTVSANGLVMPINHASAYISCSLLTRTRSHTWFCRPVAWMVLGLNGVKLASGLAAICAAVRPAGVAPPPNTETVHSGDCAWAVSGDAAKKTQQAVSRALQIQRTRGIVKYLTTEDEAFRFYKLRSC